MEIDFKDIGFIKSGKISTNDLTIIFGPNNVGKTYLSYSTFAVIKDCHDNFNSLSFISKSYVNELIKNKTVSVNILDTVSESIKSISCQKNSASMSSFFKDTTGLLDKSNVKLNFELSNLDKDKVISLRFNIKARLSESVFLTASKQRGSEELTYELSTIKIEEDERESDITDIKIDTPVDIMISYMSLIFRRMLKRGEGGSFVERPFIITSERTGISLFLKEIDGNRNNIVNEISSKYMNFSHKRGRISDIKDIFNDKVSTFSDPINHNINVIRERMSAPDNDVDFFNMFEADNIKDEKYLGIINSLSDMVNGKFSISEKEISFVVKDPSGKDRVMPISLSSASNKSLFLFDLYIKKYINKNSYLIIDEPELNLHPKNQVKMADLLVRLSNYGVKVIITTHSDHLVKEINNRVMASKIKDKSILEYYGYDENNIISPSKVSAFTISDEGYIEEVAKDDFGVDAYLFDDVILDVDEKMSALYSSMVAE